jgi:predicted lysophospholipase L1 biosynthesis ABC-type transport system permease subunit
MDNTEKQLHDLAEIKQMMERSSRFLSLSGWSGISAGVLALFGAFAAYRFMQTTSGSALKTLLVADALTVLILALSFAVLFSWHKAKKQGVALWTPVTKRLLMNMAIPLLTGGIYSIILFMQEQTHLIAGITLIFYGLALVNAGRFINREAVILGISEIILGIAASIWYAYGLWFWALGFGLFHIIYGISLYHKYDRQLRNE